MTLLDSLPHTASFRRRQRSPDSLAGHKDTPVVFATGVPCWIQPASARAIAEYQQRSINISDTIFFADDPKLTEQDQVLITAFEGGELPQPWPVYEVRSFKGPDDSVGLGICFSVMVERITAYESSTE